MDWLSVYRANVKCFEKEVVFNPLGEHEFSFVGISLCSLPQLISSLQARRYLRKGCVGYLTSVMDTKKSGVKFSDLFRVLIERSEIKVYDKVSEVSMVFYLCVVSFHSGRLYT
ncbi:hypothetical protein QYF36_014730 [Acer negundo]|nr:hypothetical protein QYF36_014730 [Acer negundo]